MKFRLGLDYDGVITRHPDHLRFLADHLMMSGGEVHIITGRRKSDREETLRRLKEMRFRFTSLHLYPVEYKWTPGAMVDKETLSDIGIWKAQMCQDLGIDLFMDDHLHSYPLEEFTCPTVHI